ncbi:hypothetical protein D3C72_1056110 [compost metagenome]
MQAQRDLGLHVGQLLLDELVGGERAAELLAVQRVLAGAVPAVFGGTDGAPRDAVAGAVQAGERALEALHFGEGVFFGAEHAVHDDFAGDAGAQADLAVDGGGRQALHALFEHEAADRADGAAFADFLGPHDEHVGDGRVADPHLRAAERVAARHLLGARGHAAGVGAMVGFGQAEAADPFAGGELGQELLLLCFGTEFEDRHHHQRALHAGHRAVARIDALDFAGDQAVGHVVQAGAAVLLGDRRAEQAERTHFAKDRGVGFAGAEAFDDAGRQALLAVGVGRVADHAFFVGQLLVEKKGVVPVELRFGGHVDVSGKGRRNKRRGNAVDRSHAGGPAQTMNPHPDMRPTHILRDTSC